MKFAAQAGDGSWAISDITSTGVQAGEYLDLAIAPDGAVHVAMYLERWRQDGREVSGVWLATSSGLPSGADSWTFSVVDSVTSCLGGCSDDEVCVADGAGARCASPNEDGCGNCDCGTACVDGACVETCQMTLQLRVAEPAQAHSSAQRQQPAMRASMNPQIALKPVRTPKPASRSTARQRASRRWNQTVSMA